MKRSTAACLVGAGTPEASELCQSKGQAWPLPSSSLGLICPFLGTEHRVQGLWLGPSLLMYTILLGHSCVPWRADESSQRLVVYGGQAWLGLAERFVMGEIMSWLVYLQKFQCLAFTACDAVLGVILSVCCSCF